MHCMRPPALKEVSSQSLKPESVKTKPIFELHKEEEGKGSERQSNDHVNRNLYELTHETDIGQAPDIDGVDQSNAVCLILLNLAFLYWLSRTTKIKVEGEKTGNLCVPLKRVADVT